jgi:hypothetical protein
MRHPIGSNHPQGTFVSIVASARCRSGRVVRTIIRALFVLLEMTNRPFSASIGASRRSSFPNIAGVLGQLGQLALIVATGTRHEYLGQIAWVRGGI